MAEGIKGEAAAAKVTSIFIYPIKSCRGISVSEASLLHTGFRWDRIWLVVNSEGRAYTQRVEPKLALIQVQLPNEVFSVNWEPNNNSYLVVRAPGMDELKVPMRKPSLTSNGVSIWEWSGSALDEGEEAAKWFSDYIGKLSRLVRFNEESEIRPVDPKYAPGYNVFFSDGYPFLLASQSSLEALNQLLDEPVSINRFRPNILVDGCEPFAEDLWKEIKINDLSFEGVLMCPRCKVPTVNQENGTFGREPNETLMKFRSDRVLPLNTKQHGRVYFGQMLVCKECCSGGKTKEMVIRVGDEIHIQEMFASYAEAPSY